MCSPPPNEALRLVWVGWHGSSYCGHLSNNCAIMFPQALAPVVSFSATFRPASSKEEDEDDNSFGRGIRRFDSSGEDLDAKDARNIKKGLTPTKVASSNTSQWTEEDIDVVHQIRSKTDLDRFQTY